MERGLPVRGGSSRSSRAGFSLVEVMVVVAILTITLSMFSSMMVSTSRITPIHRDNARAAYMASNILEEMRNLPFDERWASYNSDPLDDPGGPGTAPGHLFDVPGLSPKATDGDGRVGEVVLPYSNGQLREDIPMSALGLPRDLNGDGEVDDADHSGDHLLLPVQIRVEWDGDAGPREFVLNTLFIDA